jgi:GDPmannose 4,6-dehydratase
MPFKGRRILITGIGGFVGSHLARYLFDQGALVYGLDRAEGALYRDWPDAATAREIRFISGDIQHISAITKALDESKPDFVFHLAAHSFDPSSFTSPSEVVAVNSLGTANLLEAIRVNDCDSKIVFAGSSEEYGLVISSEDNLERATKRYGCVFPAPRKIPELPISEENPLRPISPYGVSKIHGEFLMRNYYHSYGIRTVVSRAFNHEGAGRGPMFVTSVITNQVVRLRRGGLDRISIGNVSALRDWSHVEDIVRGYCLLAEKGEDGGVYNQGSQRANSVISHILLCLEEIGYNVNRIETFSGGKGVENPTQIDNSDIYGVKFEKTRIDTMLLNRELEYVVEDKGLNVYTDRGKILIEFDASRFRPTDVPVLLADISKIKTLGFTPKHTLRDIIRDQLNSSLDVEKG